MRKNKICDIKLSACKNFLICFDAMRYLISYDISEDKIRSKMVRYLEEFAFRLQYSVFTCNLKTGDAKKVWTDLIAIAAESNGGNVLMTPLCKSCEKNLKLSDKPLEEEKGFLVV